MCSFGRKYFPILLSDNCSLYSCKCLFHAISNIIKPGSNSKTTDQHAAEGSKAVCWGVK